MVLDSKLVEVIDEYEDAFSEPCPVYNLYGKSNEEVIKAIRECIAKGERLKADIPEGAVI